MNIPKFFIQQKNKWSVWRKEENGSKKPKDPVNKPWHSLEDVKPLLKEYDGLALKVDAGFDLDNCRDPKTGKIDPVAQQLIDSCEGAYWEVSPSKCGVKIYGKGDFGRIQYDFKDPFKITRTNLGQGYFAFTGEGDGDPEKDLTLVEDFYSQYVDGSSQNTEPGTKKKEPLPEKIPAGAQNTTLFREACALRDRGYTENEIFEMLKIIAKRCPPEPGKPAWTDSDFRQIARSTTRYDPQDPLIIQKNNPNSIAYKFLETLQLKRYKGEFFLWSTRVNQWLSIDTIRPMVRDFLATCKIKEKVGESFKITQVKPVRNLINEVVDAVTDISSLSNLYTAPCWLNRGNQIEYPYEDEQKIVVLKNGILDITDRKLVPPTSIYFHFNVLPFEYNENANDLDEWLSFLNSIWPNDQESIDALQEIMGYLVSGETNFQKIFMLVGPPRSGKGTIARILKSLLGLTNVCNPTLSSLSNTFGKEVLINKSLAIISDARVTYKTDSATVTEDLLSISGEDSKTIDRKFLPAWDGNLYSRFLILTNVLPKLEDPSGALASRFYILKLRISFLGREDKLLTKKLLKHLPAIFNWSLDGYDRLIKRGYFQEPETTKEMVSEFEDLGNPVKTFVEERCKIGQFTISFRDLYSAWVIWCDEVGRKHKTTMQSFAKDLRAYLPELRTSRKGSRGQQGRHWEGITLSDTYSDDM